MYINLLSRLHEFTNNFLIIYVGIKILESLLHAKLQ